MNGTKAKAKDQGKSKPPILTGKAGHGRVPA
jgi:hypothetical protein